jgi:uncharacterized protein
VSSAAAPARPVPVPDERSAPYWAGAARHELVLARCSRCAKFSLPPDYQHETLSGAGQIRSWTVIRQSFLPGFAADVPFVLVDVELAEQPELRLIGRLLDGPTASLRIGAPAQVAFEDVADGVSVVAFTLAAPA